MVGGTLMTTLRKQHEKLTADLSRMLRHERYPEAIERQIMRQTVLSLIKRIDKLKRLAKERGWDSAFSPWRDS